MTILLGLLRQFWPYLVAFGIGLSSGFGSAWNIQGYRLTEAKQEFAGYKQAQAQAILAAKESADKQREQAAKDYAKLSGILDNEINSGVVYRRCVAAGKCGVRVICSGSGVSLPPTVRPDEASADAIPSSDGTTEKVANDCAVTTLMLNQLQADIERQAGY